jgi:hypothetical protein
VYIPQIGFVTQPQQLPMASGYGSQGQQHQMAGVCGSHPGQPSMHRLRQYIGTVDYPNTQMNTMTGGFVPAGIPDQCNQVQPISGTQYQQMGFANQFPVVPGHQLSHSSQNNDEEYNQQNELYFQ